MLLALAATNIKAQLVVDSLGLVRIGPTTTPTFLLSVDSHNELSQHEFSVFLWFRLYI